MKPEPIDTRAPWSRGIGICGRCNIGGKLAGGMWNVHLNGNYLLTFRTKSFDSLPYTDNLVGEYERYFNLPLEWKHTLSLAWNKGDFGHVLTQVYRYGYKDWKPGGIVNG